MAEHEKTTFPPRQGRPAHREVVGGGHPTQGWPPGAGGLWGFKLRASGLWLLQPGREPGLPGAGCGLSPGQEEAGQRPGQGQGVRGGPAREASTTVPE